MENLQFGSSDNKCSPATITLDNESHHLTSITIVDDHQNFCGDSLGISENASMEIVDSVRTQSPSVVDSLLRLESLCVSVPIYIRNGEIIAEERIVIDDDDDLSSPKLVIDSDPMIEASEESCICPEESSANVEVFECACEEIAHTTTPHCTLSQVTKVLNDLHSLAFGPSITTNQCCKPSIEECVVVLACSEDQDMDDVRIMDFTDIQDMLTDSSLDPFPVEVGAEVSIQNEVELSGKSDCLVDLLLQDNVKVCHKCVYMHAKSDCSIVTEVCH